LITVDQAEVEREVKRLAPWYYLYDLQGVRTDSTPAFDQYGHRTVNVPTWCERYFKGRSVLDVGCNEGAYSFSALDRGAAKVVGFDCREANVEKARFVARVNGRVNASFEIGSADNWPLQPQYDIVLLCGLLYHLPKPWETIAHYCKIASQHIFVRCVLCPWAFDDGYTPWKEGETIGASEKPAEEMSQYPSSLNTLRQEFAKHGFHPIVAREHYFGPDKGVRGILHRLRQPKDKRYVNRGCFLFLTRK